MTFCENFYKSFKIYDSGLWKREKFNCCILIEITVSMQQGNALRQIQNEI